MTHQEEIDLVVERVKKLVTKYGGNHPELAKLRAAYSFMHSSSGDPMGLVLLEHEVKHLEEHGTQHEYEEYHREMLVGDIL